MIVTTTNDVTGYRVVQHLGVVRGITVRSRSVIGNIGAGLQSIFGGNISEDRLSLEWGLVQTNDFCPGKSLVPGDTCTVGVESTHIADNTTSETNLNVSSDNSQPGGWAAPLIAGCDARLMPADAGCAS